MKKYTFISLALIILIFSSCSVIKKTQKSLTGNWTFTDIQIKMSDNSDAKNSTDIVKELIKDSYIKFIDETNVEMKISADKTIGTWSVIDDGKKINITTKDQKDADAFDIIELTAEKLVLSILSKNNEKETKIIMSFKKGGN